MLNQEETLLRIPGYRHLQNRQHISRLEGIGNYTLIHVSNDPKPLMVSQTLKRFEQHFPNFLRISKSVLVNPRYVERVIKENSKVLHLELNNGLCLLVSRRRIPETLARLERKTREHDPVILG